VTVWTIEDASGKLLYFIHDAIVGLIGADSVAQMEINIEASLSYNSYRKLFQGDLYDRTLFIFDLPLSKSLREDTIRRVCLRINKLGNDFLERFLGMTNSQLVELPHNFMRGYLTKEDIRRCDTEPSRADMDDCLDSILESPGSNANSTEIEKDGDDYDDSEYVSAQKQKIGRIITHPYRNPASDEKSITPTGTNAQSNELRSGDFVMHLSNMFYGKMVSEVMDATCDRDSAGREFPNITLDSGHVLKSDDWMRKLDARFLNDNKWDSKSGTRHQVYEFIWCGGESADTGLQEMPNMFHSSPVKQGVTKSEESDNDPLLDTVFSSKLSRGKIRSTRTIARSNRGTNSRLTGDM